MKFSSMPECSKLFTISQTPAPKAITGQTSLPQPNNCPSNLSSAPVSPECGSGSSPNDTEGMTEKKATSANPISATPIRSSLRSKSRPW